MSGLQKFPDDDTGESELEVYCNDSHQVIVAIAHIVDDVENGYRSVVLSFNQAMGLRDHLDRLIAVEKAVG